MVVLVFYIRNEKLLRVQLQEVKGNECMTYIDYFPIQHVQKCVLPFALQISNRMLKKKIKADNFYPLSLWLILCYVHKLLLSLVEL